MKNHFYILLFCLVLTSCSTTPGNITGSASIPGEKYLSSNNVQTPIVNTNCIETIIPTPDPSEISLFPKTGPDDHIFGNPNAEVSIIVYSDFQCSSCAKLAPILKKQVENNQGKVNLVFRNFPLVSIHDKAALAAQAAEAASIQSRFWEMHDFLFTTQEVWLNKNPLEFHQWLLSETKIPGLDIKEFDSALDSITVKETVVNAWKNGQKIQLPGTPVILINGEIIKWQNNLLEQIDDLTSLAVLSKNQINHCPQFEINPAKKYSAVIMTNKGKITISLFTEQSPFTANNFIYLARKNWFIGSIFYRVTPGSIIQTGDPSGTGLGGPGYFFANEKNNLVYDRAGMVGMNNSGPDTNGSQFFITLSPDAKLNNQYTIFGEVTGGMDVLMSLAPRDPANLAEDRAADQIISVAILEK